MTIRSSDTPSARPVTERRHQRLRYWAMAATVLTAMALAAAGCGGGNSTSSSGSSSGSTPKADSAQQSGLAYAQCMRSHGVSNFPDNAISDSSGRLSVNLPQSVTSNPHYQSASKACHSKLPGGGSTGNQSKNTQAELKLATCMRAHGVTNFPEPNSQGKMIITGGNSGVDPSSPTYQAAWKVCRKDLPNGGSGLGG